MIHVELTEIDYIYYLPIDLQSNRIQDMVPNQSENGECNLISDDSVRARSCLLSYDSLPVINLVRGKVINWHFSAEFFDLI